MDTTKINLDIEKAQGEAVASIVAYNDLCKYYTKPNLITFGDHVEGCRYIANSDEMIENKPKTKIHRAIKNLYNRLCIDIIYV